MGRNKIKIEKIKNEKIRLVTFQKRKRGLVKKAMELSLLCEAEVFLAVVDTSNNLSLYNSQFGLYEFIKKYLQYPIKAVENYNNNDYCLLFNDEIDEPRCIEPSMPMESQKMMRLKRRMEERKGVIIEKEKSEEKKEEPTDKNQYDLAQIAMNNHSIGNRFFQPNNYSDQITKEHTNNDIIQLTPQNEDENLLAIKNALDTINKCNNSNSIKEGVLNVNNKEIESANITEVNEGQRIYKDSQGKILIAGPSVNKANRRKMIHQIKTSPPSSEMYIENRYMNGKEYDDRYNQAQYYYQDQPPQNIIPDFYSDPPYPLTQSDYEYYQYPPMINRPPDITSVPYYRQYQAASKDTLKEIETIHSWKDNDYYINPNPKKFLNQKTYRKEMIHVEYPDHKVIRQGMNFQHQQGINYPQKQIPPYYDPNDVGEFYEPQQMRPTRRSLPAASPLNVNDIPQTIPRNGERLAKSPQEGKDFFNWLSNPKKNLN